MAELILVLVTVLLLPVFYFSSKWGFETLHQHYLAKVALTEMERRTRVAEDRAQLQEKMFNQLLEKYEPVRKELEALKLQIEQVQSMANLKNLTVSRTVVPSMR